MGFCLASGVIAAAVVLLISLPDVPSRCLLRGVVIAGLAAGALEVEALSVWFGEGCPQTLLPVSVQQEALGSVTNPIFFIFLQLVSLAAIAPLALLGEELLWLLRFSVLGLERVKLAESVLGFAILRSLDTVVELAHFGVLGDLSKNKAEPDFTFLILSFKSFFGVGLGTVLSLFCGDFSG